MSLKCVPTIKSEQNATFFCISYVLSYRGYGKATESPEAQPQQDVSSLVPCITQPYLGTSHGHAVGVSWHMPGQHAAVTRLLWVGHCRAMAFTWQKETGDIKGRWFSPALSSYLVVGKAVATVKLLGLFPQLCGCCVQGHDRHLPSREGVQGLGDLKSRHKSRFVFAPNQTARLNLNDVAKQPRLNILNNTATALIFITVIINIFITAFGVQKTGLYPTRNFRPY